MIDTRASDQQILELGFPAWTRIDGRRSIADLFFSKRLRSGIYVLGFADGERYVGLTTDVVRRFAQHRRHHDDITQITFQRVAQTKQKMTERSYIHALEAGGVPLRNRAEMSIVEGEHDLDDVVPPADQAHWLEQGPTEGDASARVEDADLRRRYSGQMTRLTAEPSGAAAVRVLARYVPLALPWPVATELTFWSLSCLPSGSRARMLARLNLNMQEVLGLFEHKSSLVAAFQLAISPFAATFGPRWRDELAALGYEVEDYRYRAGGHDQFRLYAKGEASIFRFLDLETANQAIRRLNLNLMRKGPSYWSRNHSFELADAALGIAPPQAAKPQTGTLATPGGRNRRPMIRSDQPSRSR